jgi:hypothetical protein
MGSYHGKFGFDEFSHKRGVMYKDTFAQKGALLPLTNTDAIYPIAVKATITGFLTPSQKTALQAAAAAVAGVLAYRGLRARL